MNNYVTLLLSVVFDEENYAIRRFAVGISPDDELIKGIEIKHWAKDHIRQRLLGLLAPEWKTSKCRLVDCEQISGSIQYASKAYPSSVSSPKHDSL